MTTTPAAGDSRASAHQRERLRTELTIRAAVGVLILLCDQFSGESHPGVRYTALAGVLANLPYYLTARTGRSLYAQAYIRLCGDVLFITLGLYSAVRTALGTAGVRARPSLSRSRALRGQGRWGDDLRMSCMSPILLKTARTLGLTIPQSLLLRADDVIR
jgi:hypothetical protein